MFLASEGNSMIEYLLNKFYLYGWQTRIKGKTVIGREVAVTQISQVW